MKSVILRAVYPRRCPSCRGAVSPDLLICPDCAGAFKPIKPPFCLRCGRHTREDAEYCSECESKKHSYVSGIAVFEYDRRMKRSMSDFKFNGWKENADYYVYEALRLHSDDIAAFMPDILVPVPIHRSKLAYRGYNQAGILAEGIGRGLGIRVVDDLLIRNKKTKAQKQLGAQNRGANLENAFVCDTDRYGREDISGSFRRVMLVDDIYTTGSTMEGCTRALLDAGVRQVGILSIAAGGNI